MWERTVRKFTVRLGGVGFFLCVVFLLVYRYCEQVGNHAHKGCVLAMISSCLAGVLSLWPFFRMLRESRETLLLSVIWAVSLRMLISFSLIALILLFLEVDSKWFLGCYGFFYTVFIVVDSWLILRLAGDAGEKKKEVKYEYL